MQRPTLFTLSALLRRRRTALALLIFALFSSTLLIFPIGAVRAENSSKPKRTAKAGPTQSSQERRPETLPVPPAPQITVLSPAVGSLVKESTPTFRWKLSNLPSDVKGVFYSLRVVEVLPGQSLEDAFQKNPPTLEKNNLTEDSFQVPKEAGLASEKIYAVRVAAFGSGGIELSRSQASIFSSKQQSTTSCAFYPFSTNFQYCAGSALAVGLAGMSGTGNFQWTLLNSSNTVIATGQIPPGGIANWAVITLPASALPSAAGSYTYTLTVTRGTCSQSVTITIVVFPAAAVGGSAVVAPTPICDGWTAVLDVLNEVGNVGQWEYSDTGFLGPWLNATSTFNIAGAPANTNQMSPRTSDCAVAPWWTQRWFRATVSSFSGPNAPPCSTTKSAATSLLIYCKPQAGTVTASTYRICKYATNPPVILQMSSIVGDFDWYASPGGLIPLSHNQSPFSVPVPTSTTTYYAIVSTHGPCPQVNSNYVTVTVDSQPFCTAANTALTVDKNLVCPGDAAVLTLSNCSGYVTWQESTTGASGPWTTISAGNSVQNTTDLFATTYWQAIISGPPGTTCPPITSNVIVINIKPTPVAPVVQTPPTACFGANATLSATVPAQSGVTYQWYHDDLPIAGCGPLPNLQSCTFPAEPGNYWVEASNGCETVQSNFVVLPVDILTVAISAPCCGTGVPVTLSATATSSLSSAITFTWYQGTTQIGSGPTITLTPQSSPNICVKATSQTGCTATACTTITTCP